jgi:hypothetical protein
MPRSVVSPATPPRSSPSDILNTPKSEKTPLLTPPTDQSTSPTGLDRKSAKVLKFLRDRHRGVLPAEERETDQCFRLEPEQFLALENAVSGDPLLKDIEGRSLRWGYNSDTKELTVYAMPGPLHEGFVIGLMKLLDKKLEALKVGADADRKTRKLLSCIDVQTGSETKLTPLVDKRVPDLLRHFHASWNDSPYPPLVVEVAVAQDGTRDFLNIAQQYLVKTNGQIRTFVGFDIEYLRPEQRRAAKKLPSLKAAYHVFRFGTMEEGDKTLGTVEGEAQPTDFHGLNGVFKDPVSALSLSIWDFRPRRAQEAGMPRIELSHDELAGVLEQALLRQSREEGLGWKRAKHDSDSDDSASAEDDGGTPPKVDSPEGLKRRASEDSSFEVEEEVVELGSGGVGESRRRSLRSAKKARVDELSGDGAEREE